HGIKAAIVACLAKRYADLSVIRSVDPDQVQNHGIAADLAIHGHGTSRDTRVIAEKGCRVNETQCSRDGCVAGADVVSLDEGSRHWKISIEQARVILGTAAVKASCD